MFIFQIFFFFLKKKPTPVQSWHRYQKKRWAMLPEQRRKHVFFHWTGRIQGKCFLCISLLVCCHLISFTFSVIQIMSTVTFWRMSYCPVFLLGVSIIWDSSSLSGCPSVHVSVSLVVSLKGSKIPLTSFPCSICACFVQVAKVYRYKAYHIYIPLFVHWSPQAYSIVCLKYLKGLSLNKLSKVHYFTAYFKVVQSLHLEVLLK